MMEYLDLPPVTRMAGTVSLPGSKSISNRTLLLSALARGDSELKGLLDADDVDRMLDALRTLGVAVQQHGDSRDYTVHGLGGAFPVKRAALFLGNAGTAFRPLTAALAFSHGSYELAGVARMHERPISDLVDALRAVGADIGYLGASGFPPLAIREGRIQSNPRVAVRGEISSQFVTALIMALPLAGGGSVEIVGRLISRPYVDMTANLMARFGVGVTREGGSTLHVPAGVGYESPGTIVVEGDASSASYFLAAGAIAGGPIRVEGVGLDSIQGDAQFAATLATMGAEVDAGPNWISVRGTRPLNPVDADFTSMPDAAMTAAVVALFAHGPSRLSGVGSWRVKETDRIAAMKTELAKLGAAVEVGPDWLSIAPPQHLLPATIDTYDDHRMAMCFSLASLGGVAVRINDPQCVRKTFPGYFNEFRRLAR
jgi:3-phosphoshikimate 1-carboxyvinyltransferase